MSNTNPQIESTKSNLVPETAPSGIGPSSSPGELSRLTADLRQLERSLPRALLTQDERDAHRRRAHFSTEAMYACAELTADPVCVAHNIIFPRSVVDEKRVYVEEAQRLAVRLRQLARRVSDHAVVVADSLASDAMRTLDLIDALSSGPEGEDLRAGVERARKLVRVERHPVTRKKKEPTPPPTPKA